MGNECYISRNECYFSWPEKERGLKANWDDYDVEPGGWKQPIAALFLAFPDLTAKQLSHDFGARYFIPL
jgi:hypothetical protein